MVVDVLGLDRTSTIVYVIAMNQKTIADRFNISESLVSKMKHGIRFTDDIALAIAVSSLSGKKPIAHIKLRIRDLALVAHPELNSRFHNHRVTNKA